MSRIEDRIEQLVRPTIEEMGMEFWGCEYVPVGGRATLRIYIDKPGGVTVDDCADVSYEVSGILDVEDPIANAYNLEISSPGLDRPLFNREQFERFRDETVAVRTHDPVMGRRKFKGPITDVNEDGIAMEVDGETYEIDYDNIDKANVVPKF
ncbi:ribosome maturation factor RimP [Sulfurivirga caldicuralii]|uniref:Ribosome maturation factor RimP n=1 Tax=Sulfurivirga caldicuralii TaxID=364032 RepID=A0A1N6FH15_9GAMM|nr:ribosome maturation factor RimP [Sulfurivirga caldicuralii]SIN94545.1 ribosome maturation factor RimP [Sulfurivirga caldicuralii]